MKVTISKGPNFEECSKRVYALLRKILIEKIIEEEKENETKKELGETNLKDS